MRRLTEILFAAALLFAPRRGLVAQARRRSSQRLDLSVRMLLVHLLHHQGTESEALECRIPSLHRHLRWGESRTRQVMREAGNRDLVEESGELVRVTEAGRYLAEAAILDH